MRETDSSDRQMSLVLNLPILALVVMIFSMDYTLAISFLSYKTEGILEFSEILIYSVLMNLTWGLSFSSGLNEDGSSMKNFFCFLDHLATAMFS